MDIKTEVITPEQAEQYLRLNTRNRNLRPSAVKSLAAAMSRGEWQQTPEGISFSADGVLLDGQHRLHAICLSKETVVMTVFYGVCSETFSVMNRGIPRTMSDSTGLARHRVDVLNFFQALVASGYGKATAAQIMQMDDIFGEDIASLMEYAPRAVKGFAQVGIRAAVVILSKEGQRNRAFDIYRKLVSSDFADMPPSIMKFIKQVVSGGLTRNKGGQDQVEAFCKALYSLDEKNANKKNLTFSEGLRAPAKSRVLQFIR